MHTLRVKNFVEIAPSCTGFETNTFLHLTQKFKTATNSGGKRIFGKQLQMTVYTLRIKNFVGIALSGTVSHIHTFLHFTQHFKMATKNGRKTIFGKQLQMTLCIPWGSKILSELLYLAPKKYTFLHFMQNFNFGSCR